MARWSKTWKVAIEGSEQASQLYTEDEYGNDTEFFETRKDATDAAKAFLSDPSRGDLAPREKRAAWIVCDGQGVEKLVFRRGHVVKDHRSNPPDQSKPKKARAPKQEYRIEVMNTTIRPVPVSSDYDGPARTATDIAGIKRIARTAVAWFGTSCKTGRKNARECIAGWTMADVREGYASAECW